MFLKIWQNSQENTWARIFFFNKVASVRPFLYFYELLLHRTPPGDYFWKSSFSFNFIINRFISFKHSVICEKPIESIDSFLDVGNFIINKSHDNILKMNVKHLKRRALHHELETKSRPTEMLVRVLETPLKH